MKVVQAIAQELIRARKKLSEIAEEGLGSTTRESC